MLSPHTSFLMGRVSCEGGEVALLAGDIADDLVFDFDLAFAGEDLALGELVTGDLRIHIRAGCKFNGPVTFRG